MDNEILEDLGLTKSEIKVYYALLELGSTQTGKLVDKSGVASSKIYELLDKLMEKGLANFIIKEGVKHYEAAPPKRILEYVEEKEKKIAVQKEQLKKILPELELRKQLSHYKSEAHIYKGLKGGETAFKEALSKMKKNDEWLAFTIAFKDPKYFETISKIHLLRAEKGIKARLIFNEDFRKFAEKERNLPHTEIKYLIDQTKSPAIVNILGSTVVLNMMSEEITAIKIDNEDLAKSFRAQFEILWNQDTQVTKGFLELKSTLKKFIDNLSKNETYDVLGAGYGEPKQKETYSQMFEEIHSYRNSKNIQARMLFQNNTRENIKRVQSVQKKSEIKFLPYNETSPVEVMASSKEVILIIQQGEEPTTIKINNAAVAKAFRQNFENVWNQKRK